jgi:hypothetical protein
MKKNIFRIFAAIIIMTLVISPPLAYSSLLSMAVKKINPAGLVKMGGGSAKIPAVVKSVSTNGATAMNVVNLTLTGAQLGGLAGAVIGTGIGLGIYAANPSWFIENGIRVLTAVGGGVDIVKDTTVQVPPADAAPGYDYSYSLAPPYAAADYGIGYYGTDCAAAEAALIAKCQSLHDNPASCHFGNYSTYNCISQKVSHVNYTPVPGQPGISFRLFAYCKYKDTCSWQPIDSTRTESIGPSGLADTLAPQLGNNNHNAWGLLMDVLNRISAGLNNPSHEINAEPGLMDDIQSRLQQGISANALSDIETSTDAGTGDGAVPADTDDVYGGVNGSDVVNAVQDALKGQGLSDNQIAEAIRAALASEGLTAADIAQHIWDAAPDGITDPTGGVGAVETNETINNAANAIDAAIDQAAENIVDAIQNKDEGSNVVVPVDPEVLVPEKLSLTSVLNDFYSGLQSLPMVQTFQGMAITSGGSSTLCVDLPSEFGGSHCVNFSSYEGSLNAIGSILLSMTTIFMMVYLFRG